MGWEGFYQAKLISTSIRLTELTSKREGNCNVMITGLADHGLYVMFLTTAMSSSLYCLIVATTSSLLYQLGNQSTLAFFEAKVLCVACEPNKQFTFIIGLQRKTTCRPTLIQIWCWWSEKSILTLYKGKPLEEEPRGKW